MEEEGDIRMKKIETIKLRMKKSNAIFSKQDL